MGFYGMLILVTFIIIISLISLYNRYYNSYYANYNMLNSRINSMIINLDKNNIEFNICNEKGLNNLKIISNLDNFKFRYTKINDTYIVYLYFNNLNSIFKVDC